MDFILAIVFILNFGIGAVIGVSIIQPEVRESTVKFCIEKPAECKKEFDFYQMREEFNASREKTE
jgi:hypothetical protein